MKTIILILVCTISVKAQTAKIYFIRKNESSNNTNVYLWIDNEKRCGLNKNFQYSILDLNPGKYTFTTSWGKGDHDKRGYAINVEPDKNYYITYMALDALWEVTEATGKQIISTLPMVRVKCDGLE